MTDKSEHRARKRFGQHFLHDANIVDKLIRCIDPRADQNFVEIGPGLGALTCPILKHLHKLDVIELDRDVIPLLKRNCENHAELHIHESDVLKFDFSELAKSSSLRVIGNLPYNISTPILFHLLKYRARISDMHFMLQKELVDRIAATPGNKDYGRLSVMMQTWFQPTALFDVPPGCFSPPPRVMSAIIKLVPTQVYSDRLEAPDAYSEMVRLAFSQRRKTLRNTLRSICNEAAFESAGIDPGARAETLEIEDFLRLHNAAQQTRPAV